ncbi:hypothetical protein NKH77_44230 [Streptomyces sp. M19]
MPTSWRTSGGTRCVRVASGERSRPGCTTLLRDFAPWSALRTGRSAERPYYDVMGIGASLSW